MQLKEYQENLDNNIKLSLGSVKVTEQDENVKVHFHPDAKVWICKIDFKGKRETYSFTYHTKTDKKGILYTSNNVPTVFELVECEQNLKLKNC